MFNKKDASFEIATSMEKALVANAVDKQTSGLNKLAQAMEHLNAAAEIFDDAGMRKHAEVATQLLESLAAKKSKSKSKKKPPVKSKKSKVVKRRSRKSKNDPATENLTSDKMVSNLEHKGWVFNADDNFFSNDKEEDEYDRADKALRARFEQERKELEELSKKHPHHHHHEQQDADDNYVYHGDDCMCSMCMDSDDTNYLRHGDDCMCSMCMDVDDVNDMKLGISGGGPTSHGPEYWRHMAKEYTKHNEFRKAEEAMLRALRGDSHNKKLERYDQGDDSAFGDDFNFDFDRSQDAGYHVHRNLEEGYHMNSHDDNDFEDEVEFFPLHKRY